MSRVGSGNVSHVAGLQQNQQTQQARRANTSVLSGRNRSNNNRVQANRPNMMTRAWNSVASGAKKAWNSRFCVGTGHFLQGLVGVTAFKAAFNVAAGRTDNSTKYLKTGFDTNRSEYSNVKANRTQEQARWAGHGGAAGIGTSVLVGFIPSVAGAILGGVAGLCVRAVRGAPLAGKSDLQSIRGPVSNDPSTSLSGNAGANLNKGLTAATDRVAEIASQKTNSVEVAVGMTRQAPATTRFTNHSGDKLPAKQSVRLYQAFREHGFDKQITQENQDFRFAGSMLKHHPTKQNFDFVMKTYIDTRGDYQVNLSYSVRTPLLSLAGRDNNGNVCMDDNQFNLLQTACQNGPNSTEFQQLPRSIKNQLTQGMNERGDNQLVMADIFKDAQKEIYTITSSTMQNLSSDL